VDDVVTYVKLQQDILSKIQLYSGPQLAWAPGNGPFCPSPFQATDYHADYFAGWHDT